MSNTPNLSIPHIATNQNSKEVTANTAFDDLDTAMTDTLSISIAAGSTITPSSSTVLLAYNLKATGAPSPDADVTIVVPSNKKAYRIEHGGSGSHSVTFKVSGQTGVTVAPGDKHLVYCNGTDVILADSGTVGGEITAHKDVANGYAGLDSSALLKANEFPTPTTSTFGGVKDIAAVTHNFVNAVTNGVPQLAQPAYNDLTGTPSLATVATTGAYSDLTGKPTLAATKTPASHKWLASFDSSTGLFTQTQPDAADITSLAASATTDTTNATNISSGTLALARGGTGVDLSASGGSTAILAQDGSHVVSARNLIAADIPSLAASKITSGQLALAQGGTAVDLSASGGTHSFLAQDGSHAISARQPSASDISGLATIATSGAWSDLLAAAADLTLANTIYNTVFNQTSAVNFTWANITAAVGGTNQDSPIVNFKAKYWDNTASQTDTWSIQAKVSGSGQGQGVISGAITNYSITSNVVTFTGFGTSTEPPILLKPDGTNNGTFTISGVGGADAFLNGTYTLASVAGGACTASLTHANVGSTVISGTFTMYVPPSSLLFISHTGTASTTSDNINGVMFPATVKSGNIIKTMPICFAGSSGFGNDGGTAMAGIGSPGGSQPSLELYSGGVGATVSFFGRQSFGTYVSRGQIGGATTGWGLSNNTVSDPMFFAANSFSSAQNACFQFGQATAGAITTTSGTQYFMLMGIPASSLLTDIKFQPAFGAAKFVTLALHPKINQAIVTTAVTSASITNATTAVLTVTTNAGFVNGATGVVVAGLVNANNTQLNGTWVIASSTSTTITITGTGWTSHGASGGESGTITQQATGDYTGIEVDVTETAVASASTKLLLDLKVGGASTFAVNNGGKVVVPSTNTTTSASAGANGAVPAQVVGYLTVNIAGTDRKIPYFAT